MNHLLPLVTSLLQESYDAQNNNISEACADCIGAMARYMYSASRVTALARNPVCSLPGKQLCWSL